MKICFIAPANNYHTQKWCKWFSENSHEVHVISFIDSKIDNTQVHFIDTGTDPNDSDSKKIKYLFKAKKIKKIVNEIRPDIINAHYATSYGTAVALSGIKEYILSVWGSDVYDFPNKSIIHKLMLKYSLRRAKYIFSTSNAMAEETKRYTNKEIFITPFGVDMELFSPNKRNRNDEFFIVGTVKALKPKYGINILLNAVSNVRSRESNIPIRLRIAGDGKNEAEYKQLAKDLEIDDITEWLGFISQEKVAEEWANMDVGVVPSVLDSESFGVSAVEAEACQTPLIITDIPGLMEATEPGASSIVVPRNDSVSLADSIIELYKNEDKRQKMGIEGRKFVSKMYEYNNCFRVIEKKYFEIVQKGKEII